MSKQLLSIEYDYDFVLIGLVCQVKDYRLCFEINKKLGFDLNKVDSIEIFVNKQREAAYFSTYLFENEDEISFYIIFNRGTKGYLIPEQSKLDYFVVIKGPLRADQKKELISKLKEIKLILGVFELDVKKLKSKENLLF